ncbi:RHS repeat-associated core domain-containing protein [Pontibacter sp. G13]|uniref:RHS repeat domain-containing protein n=1 Tax=Pontibacter sp. G13 TaxID=3074898 RepID=UPI00288A5EC4|nr:RHS repeat-associated core domain-containing protein [Pontibacter sp. G13]WNJ19615.1 RHS repeat-associated core domain-containing protein [Pontibacter sp. G13]
MLSVFSDRKLQIPDAVLENVDGYTAEIYAYNDYFPFGMLMPGRNGQRDGYRYGFNGMERDDEMKGAGNSYDFGARVYDSRVGRWLSLDPAMSMREWVTPYNFVQNSPIIRIDPDGMLDDIFFIYEDGSIEQIEAEGADHFYFVVETETDYKSFYLASFEQNDHGLLYLPEELCVSYCDYSDDGVEFTIRQKPNGPEDEMWIRPDAMGSLLGAAVELNTKEMAVNHFSNEDGSSPSPSSSHVQGKNGDIRYLRTDADWTQAVWVQHDEFDKTRNTNMAAAFIKYGWSNLKSFEHNGWITPGTSHLANHHHHFHLQGYSPNLQIVSVPSFME